MRWGFVKSGEHSARIILYRQAMNRAVGCHRTKTFHLTVDPCLSLTTSGLIEQFRGYYLSPLPIIEVIAKTGLEGLMGNIRRFITLPAILIAFSAIN